MEWENLFHCEINEFGRLVLKHYWPYAKSYEDIKTTDFTIWRGLIDVLSGGFPCQPYSTAGKRKGKADNRHLWPEMLRAIREIQPRIVVGENVRGLTNWDGGVVFDEVQADLEAEGYEVLPFLLPACAVNAPHRRDRIWFIAYSCSYTSAISIQQRRQNTAQNINIGGENESRIIANPYGDQRYERWMHKEGLEETGGYISTCDSWFGRPTWNDFPTQPPIRSRDDGFPGELVNITIPSKKQGTRVLKGKQAYGRWRNESMKALGNAIVPQVAFELFKAIEQYNKPIK